MPSRINVDLRDEKLYKALKIRAIEEGTSLREIVVDALRRCLYQKATPPEGKNVKGVDWAAVKRLREVRKSIFGNRILPGDSADLIREAREERLSRL